MEKKLSQDVDVRKGPWTMEEDIILMNYIANHGEGVWNTLARSAGLKRTGKSCRLRWLNYLRPDVRRGNITTEEQLLIMELHSKWGNRWSKIAKHLPGRTDNEIKNYWRTRIQKHMKRADHHHHHHHQNNNNNNYVNDQASTSQISSTNNNNGSDAVDESYYSPTSFNGNENNDKINSSNVIMEAFPTTGDQSNDNLWSVEELWSMQLINGD